MHDSVAIKTFEVGVHGECTPDGWRRILAQEGLPFRDDTDGDCHVVVSDGVVPDWLERYLGQGGTFVLTSAPEIDGLLPKSVLASIEVIRPASAPHPVAAPCLARLFSGSGSGEVRLHEDRVTKNGIVQDVYPVFDVLPVGAGHLVYSGLPMPSLLRAQGDRLRRFAWYSQVTERVSNVDKAQIADVLVDMLRTGFSVAGLPYICMERFPDGAPTVFIFRVDVDGAFDDRAETLSRLLTEHGIPASFFINAANCERWPGHLSGIGAHHEVGQHGFVHNLFPTVAENVENLERGAGWLTSTTGTQPTSFVAPRGLWNDALDEALARLGYSYSSDFGLEFDSLPFRTPSGVLQVPVHPYSPERAARFAEEHGEPPPTGQDVAQHYLRVIEVQQAARRPVHIYGHPEVLGTHADRVVPMLASEVRKRRLRAMSLGDYAAWWAGREQAGMKLSWHAEEARMTVGFQHEGPWQVQQFDPNSRASYPVIREGSSR